MVMILTHSETLDGPEYSRIVPKLSPAALEDTLGAALKSLDHFPKASVALWPAELANK